MSLHNSSVSQKYELRLTQVPVDIRDPAQNSLNILTEKRLIPGVKYKLSPKQETRKNSVQLDCQILFSSTPCGSFSRKHQRLAGLADMSILYPVY